MTVIRHADSRRTETPAAVMTTLASPTQGGAAQSLWRVDVKPGDAGPAHIIDTQQVWTLAHGAAVIETGGQSVTVEAGDTVVIPGNTDRRVTADPDTGFAAVVVGRADARASLTDGSDMGALPWAV